MKTIELIAEIDEESNLHAELPSGCPAGPVRVLVFIRDAESDDEWMRFIAHEWRAELCDQREDVYSVEDGEPLDAKK